MAEPNGSGTPLDDDPDRTLRIPDMQRLLDQCFSDDPTPQQIGGDR